MKTPIKLFFIALFIANVVYCQQDPSHSSPPNPDDNFNIFLLVFAIIVVSLTLGATFAGIIIMTGFLFLAAAFVSFGILSVSILVGIYKRSLTAGFKTFLYIACPVAGMVIGAIGFSIIIQLFDLNISKQAGLSAGIVGGLLGGLLMAFALSKITIVLTKYLLKRISH